MVNVALVGYGYWGPNLLRNLLLTEDCIVNYVCDLNTNTFHSLKKLYPGITLTTNYKDILLDQNIDAIMVATPPASHYELAKQALLAGKHVLVEKPITTNSGEAKKLIKLAKEKKRILMVDHTFVYSKSVQELKRIITEKKLGHIVNLNSSRINLGLYQNDVNVIQDLAIHDLSILDFILESLPTSILSIGSKHFDTKQEDQAYIHVWYPKNILANIHVSWLSPIKVRQMIICGTKKMAVYNDIEASEKIKVFDTGVLVERDPATIREMKVGYRRGDSYSPYIEVGESLHGVTKEFIESIKTRRKPLTDGEAGLRVIKILEAAQQSLHTGKKVQIK